MIKWHGIEIHEDPWMQPTGIAVFDGRIHHGKGLAWICTMPPCLLDKASGKLVEFPQGLIDALVELLSAPPKVREPWFTRTFPAPRLDDFRLHVRDFLAFDGGPKDGR